MARITVEDCLTQETNRFGLVQLAAKRTKQILRGANVLIDDPRANKAVVTALREIAAGQVRFMTQDEAREAEEREQAEREVQEQHREATPVLAQVGAHLFREATPPTGNGENGGAAKASADDDDGDDEE